jgi:serine/threonine protein phosphatase PrpC
MDIIADGLTDVGRKRKSNQDSFYVGHEENLFVVADGMGGHQGGDLASQMAVKLIPEYIKREVGLHPHDLIKNSVLYVNDSILEYSKKNQLLKGMGTTVVLLYFCDNTLFLANVGDSRAYLVNKGSIYQLSRDHSLVQEKLNMGIYKREDAVKDKMKNVLVRTVGFEENIIVDLFNYKVSRNDLFFICSDGLHGKVSDRDMLHIINERIPDPEKATTDDLQATSKTLIDLANANGGQDNSSVILVVTR